VTFAPRRYAKKMAEGVVRHRLAIRSFESPSSSDGGGSATIMLPGCVTVFLRSGGVMRQAHIAG
jgi:hypothetical protein